MITFIAILSTAILALIIGFFIGVLINYQDIVRRINKNFTDDAELIKHIRQVK